MRRNHIAKSAGRVHSKSTTGRKAVEPLEGRVLLSGSPTWQVQSDYFGAKTTESQPNSLRGLAISPSGNDVYGGFIQNPNTASATIREVSTAIQSGVIGNEVNTVPGTTPQTAGEDAFAQVGFQAKGVATDSRGYVYATLTNGLNSTNQFWGIYNPNLTQIVQEQSSDFIAARSLPGIATAQINGNYYVYLGWQNGQIERWNVNNPEVPVLDTSWGSTIHPGTISLKTINSNFYLNNLAVDSQGNIFVAGGVLGTTSFGDAIIKVPASVAASGSTNAGNTLDTPVKGGADGNGGFAAMGISLFGGQAYVTEYLSTDSAIGVFNMSDLTQTGVLTLPNPTGPSGLNATFPTGSDSGYSGIAISPSGQIYVAEQLYNQDNGNPYSPNGNTTITGNLIYFDRILVSSPLSLPVVSVESGNNQSTPINTTFPNELTVQVTNGGVAQVGVAVTFTAPATGASGTFSNSTGTITELTDTNGDAMVPYTANGTVGSDDVTVSTPNAASPATFDLTNAQIPTAVSVGSSLDPSVFGQSVTFNATVTPTSGTFDNGGGVQFAINGVNFGSPAALSGGVASIADSALGASATPYTVTATYSGDVDFSGNSGSLTGGQTVNKTTPTISLTPGGTVAVGTGAKMTASATLASSVDAGGTITFTLTGPSNTVVDTESDNVSGNAVYATPTGFAPTVAGTYNWVASYSGDTNNAAAGPTSPASEIATGSGVTLVNGTLYINGGNTNDQVNIQHIGQSNTGATGIQVSGQLNGVNINNIQFPVAPSSININLFNGNDSVNEENNLTIPATVTDGNGSDNIQLGQGNNSVTVGSGNDQIQAGNGNNTITANTATGQVKINLGNGNNSVTTTDTAGGQANIQVGTGNNTVSVGDGQDQITAANNGTGHNTITAGNGNDNIQPGLGNNSVTVGNGNDTIQVNNGTGQNTIVAGNGADNIQVGNGANSVTAGNGQKDQVKTGDGNNTITLGNGAQDQVQAGNGNNLISVGSGTNDNVSANNGNNVITVASLASDTNGQINVGNGDNLVAGGLGQENIQAGNGNNILIDGNAQLTQPGDSLSAVLATWSTQGASSYSQINNRLSVTYNTINKNQLHAGNSLDWFWYTNVNDQVNAKPTDLRN